MMRSCTLVTSILLCACGAAANDETSDTTLPASASSSMGADTVSYTLADFQGLRFVEGDWRGTGNGTTVFHETYRFVDDSTIAMTAWKDSTMTAAREESRYLLRDGAIRTGDGARLIRIDGSGFHFRAPTYSWTFRPVSQDRWTAQVGATTTYTMDRVVKR